jgi:hypothetical protein
LVVVPAAGRLFYTTTTESEELKMSDFSKEELEKMLEEKQKEGQVPTEKVTTIAEANTTSVTSLSDLERYAKGTVVQLPDFAEGQPFVARMRRPSMLVLAKSGKIPNNLLHTANGLFNQNTSSDTFDEDNMSMLADMYDVCRIIAESALVEPTLDEIEKAGLELSDNQMMAIFSYTQVGVEALKNFR